MLLYIYEYKKELEGRATGILIGVKVIEVIEKISKALFVLQN